MAASIMAPSVPVSKSSILYFLIQKEETMYFLNSSQSLINCRAGALFGYCYMNEQNFYHYIMLSKPFTIIGSPAVNIVVYLH